MEKWKPVVGWEGKYQVSSFGRVVFFSRNLPKTWKNITTTQHREGYIFVKFYKKEDGVNKSKTKYIHRLVAEAFIQNPENKPYVNHKNCDKTDNRVENLEWCTAKENVAHAKINNRLRYLRGEESYKSVLTEKQVREIRIEYANGGVFQNEIAKRYGVNKATIYYIVRRINWKHVL